MDWIHSKFKIASCHAPFACIIKRETWCPLLLFHKMSPLSSEYHLFSASGHSIPLHWNVFQRKKPPLSNNDPATNAHTHSPLNWIVQFDFPVHALLAHKAQNQNKNRLIVELLYYYFPLICLIVLQYKRHHPHTRNSNNNDNGLEWERKRQKRNVKEIRS